LLGSLTDNSAVSPSPAGPPALAPPRSPESGGVPKVAPAAAASFLSPPRPDTYNPGPRVTPPHTSLHCAASMPPWSPEPRALSGQRLLRGPWPLRRRAEQRGEPTPPCTKLGALMGGAVPRAPFTALGSLGALEAHRLWPFFPNPETRRQRPLPLLRTTRSQPRGCTTVGAEQGAQSELRSHVQARQEPPGAPPPSKAWGAAPPTRVAVDVF
jgi:hypothetical protein